MSFLQRMVPSRLGLRWSCPGGYREVLALALPLIISTASWSIQNFVDRMFLSWYSPEAIAASTPAGMLGFTFVSLFIGTGAYVNTFVAQYHGAGRFNRIGPAVWQGIYIAMIGGIVMASLIFPARHVFGLFGHDPLVAEYETVYFRIMCLGAAPGIAASVMSGFFSGRGIPMPVMWINLLATSVNIVLDYFLIFGNGGFPELGVAGAATATVISMFVSFSVYVVLALKSDTGDKFGILAGWRLDRELFGRLLRFGFPNGVQFMLDVAGFTIFIIIIGGKGTAYLAASNIAINVNTIAFHPMIGLGMAISILVGQYLGANDTAKAETAVFSGFHMMLTYMSVIASLFVLTPNLFLAAFAVNSDSARFEEIRHLTVVILRFVAFYSVFDALNIVFSYAIKGAGDTKYVMKVIVTSSLFVLVIPSYIVMIKLDGSVYAGWAFASLYVVILALAFFLRFLGGKWKSMRVIEHMPPAIPPTMPASPVLDLEP